ncbi:MAG: ABC transporter permease [Flavobacteriales bacterium]|nr:ABC transporter permease [Flavobacteriales bacterium]
MAWRNLWRNKRRTLLTVSSIAFAVFIAVVMRGFQLGSYETMIEGTLKATTGHIQLQHTKWWNDKSIEHIFDYTPELVRIIKEEPNVINSYPRFQNFALASNGPHTKGVPVFGIEPENEKKATGIEKVLIKGEYLKEVDHGVLISVDLAKYLQADVGDSIVLFGQGYHGITAVGKYPVVGIFDYSFSAVGNAVVYMNLNEAQLLYGAEGKITTLSIALSNNDFTQSTQKSLNSKLNNSEIAVVNWEKLNEKLIQSIQLDNVSGQIMIGVLYMIIAFGIFGTLLMMAAERKREFSVMNSIGMRRSAIIKIVFFETVWLALVAVFVGMVISIPVNVYFYFNPIHFAGEAADMFAEFNIEPVMRMSTNPSYIYWQAIIVLIICVASLVAPINLIKKLNVVDSLRGR